ncbi:MAG: GDP-mannose 4,6-dehydratase [Anaerolineales bacterium]|nr:GDP-mannose 4,6-dehydratase [Anaerolineales bacterium]
MADYLVTGAAGFIAYRVVETLLKEGHSVTGVDNMNDAYDVRMKEYRLKRLQAMPGFTFHRLDVSDRSILDPATFGLSTFKFDAVINLAARAGVRLSTENPWVYIETNIMGTLNLLEICRRYVVPKFILASTSSIYGANPPLPTPEEAASDRPLQPYAASKKGAEALCHSYHHLFGVDISILRYFTVYGPAGRPDLAMFRFTQWISEGRPVHVNGDGEQSRGFTYLDDIARGTILGLKPLGFEIINLGGHEVITVNNLIKLLEQVIGKKAQIEHHPFHPADMQTNWADVSKARRLLGWEPQTSLNQGVQSLVDWYNSERDWASQVLTP